MLYPLRDKINIFIYPAIFGVSRWLPFEGENKEIYQSGLVFAFPDAYQMWEKFSKSFIIIEFSCSIPWEEKIIFEKTLYFSRSRAPPLEGIFRKFRKPFIKSAFSCSTTWGKKYLRQRRGFWLSSLPTYWGKKKIFKRLNFRFFSWSTPWGRKFRSRHNFWPLQVGTSEEIFKTEVKKRLSRWLLFGREIFWKHPAKWLFSLGISEEKKIPSKPHFLPFLGGYSLGDIWKPLKKGSLPGDM